MTVTTVPLGVLADVVSGGTPSRSKPAFFGGDVPWVKIGDMLQGKITRTDESITQAGLKESSAKLLPAGTLLLSIFATIGRTAVLEIEAATNQAIAGIRIKDETRIDGRYLRRYLERASEELVNQGRGVAQANINLSILRSHQIPLPPIEEQRRIAAVLDAAAELRTRRRQALAKLDTLIQAIFIDMFGDPYDGTGSWVLLSDLVRTGDRINYGVVQPGDDVPGGVPLIRVGDIVDGKVDHSSIKLIATEIDAKHRRSRLVGDEVLVSCVGSTGAVALATKNEAGWNVARAVARVPLAEGVSRDYVAAFLRSPFVQRYFANELRTVSQPTLNIKQIKETPVRVAERWRQDAFVDRLGSVNDLRSHHLSQALILESLIATLQQRAFRGEL